MIHILHAEDVILDEDRLDLRTVPRMCWKKGAVKFLWQRSKLEKHIWQEELQYDIGKVVGKGDMSVVSFTNLVRKNQMGEETVDPTPLIFKELFKDYALNASYRNRFWKKLQIIKT